MAQDSKIEWTHHTANLWHGCTAVHEGCDHCYAELQNKRWGGDNWGNDKPRIEIKDVWKDLARYQKLAAGASEVHRVFVGSMMDIAEKTMPLVLRNGEPSIYTDTDFIRQRFFRDVVPTTPNLLYLFLSKRPSNYNKYAPYDWRFRPPTNAMFGTSIVNPATAKTLLPQLKAVSGKRFLSIEPQLEAIRTIDLSGIDWVICGGESGPKKRPFNTDWGRYLRDECARQNVPYFFKQIDKVQAIPDDLLIRQFPA